MQVRKILKNLKGLLSLLLIILNTFFWCTLLLFSLLIAIFLSSKKKQILFLSLARQWVIINQWILTHIIRTALEVQWPSSYQSLLKLDEFYLVIANHQTWTDILILQQIFRPHIPMLKFFAKKQLRWLPLIGQACWLYGFPFLHRHSAAELKKHPEWRQKDIASTKKACERFKQTPGSLMIFLEGTRFSAKKSQQQAFPFRYLLKPKTGGLGIALHSMGKRIKTIIDATIIYLGNSPPTFWHYCCGNIEKIVVIVKTLPVTPILLDDSETHPELRQLLQKTIHQCWLEKDQTLTDFYHAQKFS